MAKRIVVVGSINLDLVASTQRIPIGGETVSGLTFRTFPGGKGANQAVAAARLGGSVNMLGKLGADAFGVQLRDSLEESNVNTAAVQVVSGSSGVALITTDARGENAIPWLRAQMRSSRLPTSMRISISSVERAFCSLS